MKKVIFILIAFIGLGLVFSCQKEKQDPVLDMSKTVAPVLNSPAEGSEFVLTKANEDSVAFTVKWSEASYNLTNLENIKYALQVDLAGNNFANFSTLFSGEATSYDVMVLNLNNMLLGKFEIAPFADTVLDMRVCSFINTSSEYSYAYSDPISVTVTTYEDVVVGKSIYILGDATTVGWDNTLALQMAEIAPGVYARVETLVPSLYFKFISNLGAWAPQWGTDENGTLEGGNLVYRPTEDDPDPSAIPSGDADGAYYIEADTANLTYVTYQTSGELYLVGDGCSAGWDNANGIQFTEGPDHVFTLTTTLFPDAGLKFLEVPGEWAPQWGTDDQATGSGGLLVYRPNETVADPPEVPTPDTEGSYLITVDMTTLHYKIESK